MLRKRCWHSAYVGWAGGFIPAHQSFLLVVVGREKNLPTLHLHLRNVSYEGGEAGGLDGMTGALCSNPQRLFRGFSKSAELSRCHQSA